MKIGMEYIALLAKRTSQVLGVNPKHIVHYFRGIPIFLRNYLLFKKKNRYSVKFPLNARFIYPQLTDRFQVSGTARGHYFHQDLWAARKIFKNNPAYHVDVGSRIDGFISHLLVFRDVVVVDTRPLTSNVSRLEFIKGDIKRLKFPSNNIESLSCLHAIEHIGLGRYGDDLDPDGWVKGLRELDRVLKPNGSLYIGVPIGVEKLYFDAHRIFNPSTIIETLGNLDLVSFSYVDDFGDFYENAEVDNLPVLEYGCGLFEFVKKRG